MPWVAKLVYKFLFITNNIVVRTFIFIIFNYLLWRLLEKIVISRTER